MVSEEKHMAVKIKGKEIVKRIAKDIKGGTATAAAFLVYYLAVHLIFRAFCPLLILTGLPCPGCGLTRAALSLLKGQAARAAYHNPSIFLLLIFILYCSYFRYIKGTPVRGIRAALGILVFGMLAVYGIRMYLYFPGQAPYVYQGDNLLAAWVPGYGEWMRQMAGRVNAWRLGMG